MSQLCTINLIFKRTTNDNDQINAQFKVVFLEGEISRKALLILLTWKCVKI